MALLAAQALSGCLTFGPLPTASPPPSITATPSPSPRPTATPTPSPTPLPTPTYTNPPDPELAALIPDSVSGASLVKPDPDEYAITPGDIGEVFGEIGLHFRSLVIAYVVEPRTALYAMRLDRPVAETTDLEPHLAEIGRYVGIAGLHPEPWRLVEVGGSEVWTRPGDAAVLRRTTLYTWLTDEHAFLLIGASDSLNRAIVSVLPREAAPTPAPTVTPAPAAS